jgi:polyprenyl-phospho-N-acetylgalactosaminyl synthase
MRATSDGTPRIMITVPAYNEAGRIAAVVQALRAKALLVIVIDDGSTDHTAQQAEAAGAFVLRHVLNRGQGAALQTGITFALLQGGDIIVTFDADGQHDPDDLDALIGPILRGECAVTLGSRFLGRAEGLPWSRWLILQGGRWFTRLISRIQVTDVHNGLRALSAQAAQTITLTMDRMAHASELLEQLQTHQLSYQEIPMTLRYTSYSLRKGQSNWQAVRIALHVLLHKVYQWSGFR